MRVRNTTDGTTSAPYLRPDLNLGTLCELPAFSQAPRGDERAVLSAIKAAGYRGIQGGDRAIARELGLGYSGGGRVNQPAEADEFARQARDAGMQAATLHVGWGTESDAEIDRLVDAIIEASNRHDVPIYIETHRATITQDIWRTVEMVRRHPDIRFNGDFSHWYTGLEMPYGDITAKFDFLEPVFARVRFFHGRIGDPSCMQVDCGDGTGRSYVDHFREMWTRSCVGFLRSASPGDYISFAPELLHPSIHYARVMPDGKGGVTEFSDRWLQALVLVRIAQDAFAEAQRRLARVAAAKA
jgi:hypothetical protein